MDNDPASETTADPTAAMGDFARDLATGADRFAAIVTRALAERASKEPTK